MYFKPNLDLSLTMSFTKENLEVKFPENISVRVDGSEIKMKVYLLAGAPESVFSALTDFFETVSEQDVVKVARDLFHTELNKFAKTGWLNYCELSCLTEALNVKAVFISSRVNMFQSRLNGRTSVEFNILLQFDDTALTEQSSQELDSNDSCWNFNTLEKVRETSDYNI